MKIHYFGHAAVGIETRHGFRILMDPYEPDAFGGRLAFSPIPGQWDVVLISHEHDDHNHVAPGFGNPAVIRTTSYVHGIHFDCRTGRHGTAGGTVDAEVKVFRFTVDGLTILHAGDIGGPVTLEMSRWMSGADLAFLPVGGNFTIGPEEARGLFRQGLAKVVVPIHYRTASTDIRIGGLRPFLDGIERVRTYAASVVDATPEVLPPSPEVWVIPPSNARKGL